MIDQASVEYGKLLKFLLKLFIGFFLLIVICICLGVSGAYFYVWPTFLNDQSLDISETTKFELNELLAEEKFHPAPSEFYFGAPNESVRIAAETKANLAIKAIIEVTQNNDNKSAVLFSIKNSLYIFDDFDSEEKDRALHYFEKALDILKIKSSNELFNVWRYGFPYGWIFKESN